MNYNEREREEGFIKGQNNKICGEKILRKIFENF